MTDQLTTIAVLGTGIMGSGMARNLASSGFAVRAWNRTPAKAAPLADLGVTVAPTSAEAVAGADLVLTMLFDAEATIAVLDEARLALTPGTTLIQCATVGIDGCQRLGELAAELGLVYVDAPVMGTRQPAWEGNLVILASGPPSARARVEPVFEAIGRKVIWAGPAGQGSRLKLALNGWVVTLVEGVAEALTLAQALDVSGDLVLEALRGGPLDSVYLQSKGTMMLTGDFTPSFTLSAATKDARFITEAARAAGLDLGVLEAARRHMETAMDAGHGDLDLAAMYLPRSATATAPGESR